MQDSLLVIRVGSLGDVVLSSATVLNLRIAYPDHHLVYLTRERYRTIVEKFSGVDRVVALPDNVSTLALSRCIFELDKLNFGLIVDLHGNFRSWLIRTLLTPNSIQVYPKRRLARWLATLRKKKLPIEYPHTIDLYNQTLGRMNLPAPCQRPIMAIHPLSPQYEMLLKTDRQVVIVAPGAAHPTKAWPVERFAAVTRELRERRGVRIIWAITSGERPDYTLPRNLANVDTIEIVDCPLHQIAALAARAALALTNDSGVGHLASAVGTPVLALFGPTHPVLGFAPRGLHDRIMQVDEPCRPCSRHGRKPCWREERFCFTRITVESVVRAAEEIMDETSGLAPALFVDRDGTLIVNKHYLADPEQVELIGGSVDALNLARQMGYRIIVLSNQSGIARGLHSYEDAEKVNRRVNELLAQHGVGVDGIYFCPHHEKQGTVPEYAVACRCRKPAPGMAERAALEHKLDLRRSVVIGDSMADYNLGRVIGARSFMVRTGYGASVLEEHHQHFEQSRLRVAENLYEAVRRLADERHEFAV